MLWLMDKIFWSSTKIDMRRFANIQKDTTGQMDDYTTGCLIDYPRFKENYKFIAIDLSKNLMLIQKQRSKSTLLEI